ncbi:glycoside hydrolase domain-containing protein [Salirhabdus sp. Marseille-P4669]|uniref:glycoside hydrolase domain-containing protein n=1 Tax=Salirhabdus sp. Marseille-P4669 TaxID=2042310 RepID=UPI000C7BB29B|nr:glycoside hydrolase domain-containing protein [Salirhabdus sp. Marseille-P4669]
MPYIWGVDSSTNVTTELYNCVLNNFGKPEFWGRYLTTVPNASEGLTQEEMELLHNSGTRILPIYNKFTESRGYRAGRVIAQNAAFHAKRLGFPKGTVLYANVERFFSVDEAWIRGYVDAMFTTDYKPGFYHDPVEGNFSKAYCDAVANNEKVSQQSVLWSAEPEPGVTRRREAPTFNPRKVPCNANVWGWQYGRDAESCPIDTNLVDERMFNMMW